VSRQILPKRLSTVDDVLQAWQDGENEQLADHKRVVDAVLRLSRACFKKRYEMSDGDKLRTLRDIPVVLEKEAEALKKN